jgi:hypothetical protein
VEYTIVGIGKCGAEDVGEAVLWCEAKLEVWRGERDACRVGEADKKACEDIDS